MDKSDFPPCPICGADAWSAIYSGPVRDGAFGKAREGRVARCDGCKVDRLAESACLDVESYRGAYRDHLGQGHDLKKHLAEQDELARFTLDTLWPESLRGKHVADIGCAGGGLLDHLRGIAGQAVAVDPDEHFAVSLRERGYDWYPNASEAVRRWQGKIDTAFAIQVIEHVLDPRAFLAEIRPLLASNGLLIVSTPNRADILLDLLPGDFAAFFYRTQHRWYFDSASLSRAAELAGFRVEEVRHVHRYGMANALLWLRDRRPAGRAAFESIDRSADDLWRSWLESKGRSDNLYVKLRVA